MSQASEASESTCRVIEAILEGCAENQDRYRRYMTRTCWRVAGDFRFLRAALPELSSVLDIGATPPLLAGLLKASGAPALTVIDPRASLFSAYLQREGIKAIDADILSPNLDLEPVPHQLVCFCEVLEHLTGNLPGVMKQLARWVAPSGYFYVTTPNLRSVSGAFALFRHGSGLASKYREGIGAQYARAEDAGGYYGHVREYTEKEVIELAKTGGFRHVRSSFQVHPRAETFEAKVIQWAERALPPFRLYGKYLFQKQD